MVKPHVSISISNYNTKEVLHKTDINLKNLVINQIIAVKAKLNDFCENNKELLNLHLKNYIRRTLTTPIFVKDISSEDIADLYKLEGEESDDIFKFKLDSSVIDAYNRLNIDKNNADYKDLSTRVKFKITIKIR